ncbi:MAG TPA: hypothetical protein VFT90_11735 [Chryseosolibacter sp.]|nr:hypothetical protein [Chryseosolibacter sp.]
MRKLLFFLLLTAFIACSKLRPSSETFPHYEIEQEDWIIYEGILPANNGKEVKVELSLVPATPGMDSDYQMKESFHSEEPGSEYAASISSIGKYTVLSSPGGLLIRLIDKRNTGALFLNRKLSRTPDKEFQIKEDLYLKSNGEHELILVDGDFNAVDRRYTLTRRTSPLFTVEGYFTVYSDTTDFFEKNTRKKWSVAHLGEYDEAVKKYNYLAKENFEGVYVKALSYSVLRKNKKGEDVKALVFKRILEIDSMPALTMK